MTAANGALLSLRDFERRAQEQADPQIWDFVCGGADDELTLAQNLLAFDEAALRPRVLAGVKSVDTATTVLGTRVSLPVLTAPVGLQKLTHPLGELASAKAARDAGTIFVISTLSTTSIEDITALGGACFFQLYVVKDRELTASLVKRAEVAGCRALVVTVDATRVGNRLRDVRSGFSIPASVAPALLPSTALTESRYGSAVIAGHARESFEPALSWETLRWLRTQTSLPIVLKGVLHPEDARRAVDEGVEGIIVSNHGGRQLDGSMASLHALDDIAQAVSGRCELMLDGGVRRGTDVLRARACGAQAVLVGRPMLWGLMAEGSAGVRRVLELLREELTLALQLCGCANWHVVLQSELLRRRSAGGEA